MKQAGEDQNFSVDGSRGIIVAPANSGHRLLRLHGTSVQDVDALTKVTYVDAMGGSGKVFADIILRRQGNNSHYRVGMFITGANAVWMRAQKNSTTVIPAVKANLVFSPGDTFVMRAQAAGANPTTLRARVWKQGTPEPSGWLILGPDDAAALQTAGSVGVRMQNANPSPMTLRFDDLLVTRL